MIVTRAASIRLMFLRGSTRIVIVFAIVAAIEAIHRHYGFIPDSLSITVVGLLATALSIFLVFRVNEAYARWWEARILWGGLVNASRTLARQVTTLIESPEKSPGGAVDAAAVRRWRREFVYRHLAYINALRMSLRCESDWDSLAPFLDGAELDQLKAAVNKPAQLLQKQGERLAVVAAEGLVGVFPRLAIDATLTELTSLEGGCERIKNTVFPRKVSLFTELIAWGLAIVVPIAFIEENHSFDLVDLLIAPLIVLAFLFAEKIGSDLRCPFENQPNDTPMSSLCVTIEIDLRQQLGEEDLPTPLEPKHGVLM